MFTVIFVLFLIVFGLVSLVALLGNGLIIVTNGRIWFQSKKRSCCDTLLMWLSISRFLMHVTLVMNEYLYDSSLGTDAYAASISYVVWSYCNLASSSCNTSLSVFYCLKVATFVHPLFLWLKARTDKLVYTLLTMSFTVFVAFSLPSAVDFLGQVKCYNLTGNRSRSQSPDDEYVSFSSTPLFFTAFNFGVCLAATILLLTSLRRHTRCLKQSGINVTDLSTQVHVSIMKSLLVFLFFYILNFIILVIYLQDFFNYDRLLDLACNVALSAFPSAHSVIIILSNPKLKKICSLFLNIRSGAASTIFQESGPQ